MLEILVGAILRALVTTCVRYYISSLLGAGAPIAYDAAELGYRIPKWYMNPGKPASTFYAYGTAVNADAFEAIDAAQDKAVEQMAIHLRRANRQLVADEIRYDAESVRQKRLIELFIRGEGLEEFIRMQARIDRKQLVTVKEPTNQRRAFVRLALEAKAYTAYQGDVLPELKRKLTQRKTEDIMDEMAAELAKWENESPLGERPGDIPPPNADPPEAPVFDPTMPPAAPASPPPIPPRGGSDPFAELEAELDGAH